jgi:hypothetical protein
LRRPPLLARDGALVSADVLRKLGHDERTIRRALHGLPEVVLPSVRRVYYAVEDVREALRREAERR